MDPVAEVLSTWREEANVLERHGHEREADQLRRRAEEMEDAFERWREAELTVAEASDESGYSEKRLREMVREGRLPDTRPEGSQGRITIRRCDLPRKPAVSRHDSDDPVDRLEGQLRVSRR